MKIITVDKPIFKWNDEPYIIVETQILKGKNPFYSIHKIIKEKEKEGCTHCFIYSITNSPAENKYDACEESELPGVLYVRWMFVKINNDEPKLGRNIKKIEKILRS